MNFLRSLLHMIFMAATVIPWALAAVILSPFVSRAWLYRFCVAWIRLVVWAGRCLLGIENRVTGRENLPTDPSARVVLLVKHQSTWETFAMATVIRRPLAYVFKRELLFIPFFGWALGRLRMIHIDRRHGSQAFAKMSEQGRRAMEAGSWVILFPEGTRIPRGQIGKYHTGGARLAKACGACIIPVAVTSAKCWPRKAFIKRPGIVDIAIGPPIDSAGREHHALTREAQDWIETRMRRLDPQAYSSQIDPQGAP